MIKPFIRAHGLRLGYVIVHRSCLRHPPPQYCYLTTSEWSSDQADQHIAGTNHPPDKIALIAPASNISVIIVLSSNDDGLREMDVGVSLFCEKVC